MCTITVDRILNVWLATKSPYSLHSERYFIQSVKNSFNSQSFCTNWIHGWIGRPGAKGTSWIKLELLMVYVQLFFSMYRNNYITELSSPAKWNWLWRRNDNVSMDGYLLPDLPAWDAQILIIHTLDFLPVFCQRPVGNHRL